MKNKILIICGPTSSGKTALALHLAGGKRASIISADSRQVYRGLDTLTGKDIPVDYIRKETSLRFRGRPVVVYEKDNLRLWGFDLLYPDETYNAADFSNLTREIVAEEQEGGRIVMVVGGTGFYLKSLTQPETLAEVAPDNKLRKQLSSFSKEELAQKLWEINPQKFISLNQSDVSNPRRLIRAIEVAKAPTGSNPVPSPSPFAFAWVGLALSLDEIKEKIALRVDNRLNAAVSEVKILLAAYPDRSLPIYTSLGVGPILRYLAGEVTREQVRELWITDEVNYAKRQLTWFKKQNQIIWYDQSSLSKIKPDQFL